MLKTLGSWYKYIDMTGVERCSRHLVHQFILNPDIPVLVGNFGDVDDNFECFNLAEIQPSFPPFWVSLVFQ